MTIFTTKNILAAATLAIMLPLSAQARPYAVCYADTGDAPGCWLSEWLGGAYVHNGKPDLSGEDKERVDKLISAGYMKIGPIKGESKAQKVDKAQQKHVQVCKTGAILDMIEKKVPAEKIAASCYK